MNLGNRRRSPRAVLVLLLSMTACGLVSRAPEPAPTRGGSVGIGITEVDSLDPSTASSFGSTMILRTACDGLTRLDPGGQTQAGLAAEWRVTNSGKTITFDLLPKSAFHDGEALSAQALVESLSRIVRPETQSPWASLLAEVEGFGEVQRGEARSLSGLRAVDTGILEVVLTNPAADLPSLLSHPAFVPVAEIVDGIPVCAGPYRISRDGDDGKTIVLKRTGAARGLEEITFRVYDAPGDAYGAFRNKEIAASVVPDDSVAEASSVTRGYLRGETPEITFLAMDVTKSPTDNQMLRQSMSLALDRLATIDATFGDQRPAALRWAVALAGETGPGPCGDLIRRISDPQRAKQTLSESGIDPASVSLPLYFDQTRVSRLVTQAIEVQISDTLGLKLVPSPLDPPGMEASIKERTSAGLWMVSAGRGLPIPGLLLDPLFRTGGQDNRLAFSNPEVDAALLDAKQSAGAEERAAAYVKAEGLVCEQMPSIPLWRGVRHWTYDPIKLTFDSKEALDYSGALILRNADVP